MLSDEILDSFNKLCHKSNDWRIFPMYTLQDFLNDFSPHGVKLFTGSNMLKSTGIEFISVQEYPLEGYRAE